MTEFVAGRAERQQMSQFNQRSDSAANRLRAEINRRQGTNLESNPVAVGPDGQPAAPPPPPGSYARQAYDQARAEQQQAAAQAHANMQSGQPTQQQVVGDQPPAGTSEQQSDGSVAPPMTTGQPEAATPEAGSTPQLTENANRRIQQLVQQLREKDTQIAELSARSNQFEGLQKQVNDLMQEREKFLQQGLDELDPETRAAIFAESRFQQMLEQNNQRMMAALEQRLSPLQQQSHQSELERIAKKYPGFDMQIHPPLMDQFRAKFPGLTMEMAFKAVAEGDEAVPRDVAQQVAIPPVVPANHGNQLPRYMPEPQPDPDEELRDFQRRTNQLLRSTNPAEQREGTRMLDEVLKRRLSGSSYAGKPGVFG